MNRFFLGFTHQPAVDLAERLVNLLPSNLNKVFYSDNGSTSVEIAMKVAIQYWYNKGIKKSKFLAFKGGYHGDTFGAMSVGLTSGFYEPFKEIVNDSYFFDFPDDWFGNNQIDVLERKSIHQAEKIINDNKNEIAAVIIEPSNSGCRQEKNV